MPSSCTLYRRHLRAEGKKDLSWIVHTCGYGCYECRRVSFHSVSGFTTYETAPPR